jgi:hypothetical protein
MRVVSLVPSLTEALAVTAPDLLIGATDWCTQPDGLDVPRVGGSKYPDIRRVVDLRPDLVIMNVEENRDSDAVALRRAGVRVHVTYPRTVLEALDELETVFSVVGVACPGWLYTARGVWDVPIPPVQEMAVIPVWRKPWVVLGSDTFAGDMLRRLGIGNVFGLSSDRYPRPTKEQMLGAGASLAVLPDEPYPFTGPFFDLPYALVSGRHLTWYGPSLVEAGSVLRAQLAVRCAA